MVERPNDTRVVGYFGCLIGTGSQAMTTAREALGEKEQYG